MDGLEDLLAELKQQLKDAKVKAILKEVIVEELKLAKEIHDTHPQFAIGDILPKVDDIISRIWDWIMQRRKREEENK